MIYSLRYKTGTINRLISPFFLIYAYVLLASAYGEGKQVLKSMLAWYWLNQIFFGGGVGSGFYVERMEGTFVNIALCPVQMTEYLFWKYLYVVFECVLISINVLLFGNLFGIYFSLKESAALILFLMLSSVPIWALSLIYNALCLKYKKMSDVNAIVQQMLGILSGYTAEISVYPFIVRFCSYLIPLTYTIFMLNEGKITSSYLAAQYGIGAVCMGIGIVLTRRSVDRMRQRGEIEQW